MKKRNLFLLLFAIVLVLFTVAFVTVYHLVLKDGEVPTDPPPTDPPGEYIVTTNYVNVRTGASTGYDKVRQCNKGDRIWVYRIKVVKDVEWGKLEDGWICLKYAKKAE